MLTFDGRLLRQERETSGLRREAVAMRIGRSAESIAAYERGSITPPATVVGALADVIGCDVGAFYSRMVGDRGAA